MWPHVIDTSPESDYGLVLFATVLTVAVCAWSILGSGWNPVTAVLSALTVVLVGASVYARIRWRRAVKGMGLRRARTAKLRASR